MGGDDMTLAEVTRPCEDDGLTSVSKALGILELMAEAEHTTLGVTELALAMGMPKSTVHRLLKALESRGFTGRVGSKYRLGNRFVELGEAARWSEHGQLRNAAARPLERLFDETGGTVHLAVLDRGSVLYLEKLTGPGGCRIPTRVGARMPANCTALGKAMLAFSAPEVIGSLIAAPLTRCTPYSIVVPRMLLEQLQEIRPAGVALDREEAQLGITCVAAPVLQDGKAVAAVSVGGATDRFVRSRHLAAVREAATAIAWNL